MAAEKGEAQRAEGGLAVILGREKEVLAAEDTDQDVTLRGQRGMEGETPLVKAPRN